MTAASADLLDELQSALAHGTLARRVETLRRVTDLFLVGAGHYSDEQVELFDDVFACLIERMEAAARTLLAQRLAPVKTAPPKLMRTLAFDDLIEVAAPVLSQSDQIDDAVLIESAHTSSQLHLMAICGRPSLSANVTDVLVARGNNAVVHATARNAGATFSELGFAMLVDRSVAQDDIAACVGLRPDIPRHQFLRLVAIASAKVRARLEAVHPDRIADISLVTGEVTRRVRSSPSALGRETMIAHGLVRSLYEEGRLEERQIAAFAKAEQFDEANAAIACLAQIPIEVAEAIMIESRVEGVVILAKVAGLSWLAVEPLIAMREKMAVTPLTEGKADRESYERLRLSTAQQALRFHRMQHSPAQSA